MNDLLNSNELQIIFSTKSLLYYSLGFVTFIATMIDDIINPSKVKKTKKERIHFYLTEFVYTVLSIFAGVLIATIADVSQSLTCAIAIIMGLIGSTLIRKIKSKQETIAETVIDRVTDKVADRTASDVVETIDSQFEPSLEPFEDYSDSDTNEEIIPTNYEK